MKTSLNHERQGTSMTGSLKVFLVEDSATIRNGLIGALADLAAAHVVATAATEDQAIAWLAKHKGRWDLAVVDLFLQQGTGLGVVRWCQGREAGQRVVVLTNYARELARRKCLEAGADRVFDKSTELEEFFAFCQQVQADRGRDPPAA
jgi:CheY-like chemotaxis protein